jgi:hypothetical protein
MTAQAEFIGKTFDQVFEGFRKAGESTLQMQQEFFRQWAVAWPGFVKPQFPWVEQAQKFHKEWAEVVAELTKRCQESWDRQYKAGMQAFEQTFKLAEARDVGELRQKSIELWRKSFDWLKELAEAQMKDFQAAVEKWAEFVTRRPVLPG